MALFTKKPKKIETLDDAIAPFAEVKANLSTVMNNLVVRMSTANKRIADAQSYAAEVERTEKLALESASAEQAKAEKILSALNSILGEDEE